MDQTTPSVFKRIRTTLIGPERDLKDRSLYHALALTAFLAWIGLGADGLSSACYGPEEAYLALGEHTYLALIVALASAITVFTISASYMQIIELFPSGGGGYLVASKMLSPAAGMISGCALLIDYILTIALSVASGTDALFSFLPLAWHGYKLMFSGFGVLMLVVLNLRGVRESVVPLIPVMLGFVGLHLIAIFYALVHHGPELPGVIATTASDFSRTKGEIGLMGIFFLLMKSYSFGAGTYTGIEAVSNGLPIIREPRVGNGKRTMRYMAISLATVVTGLIMAYLLFGVHHEEGKTLNAVLFEKVTEGWGSWGTGFVFATLIAEAMLLFVAAQTGFLGGPRVLANMALDRWFPTRFVMLSDRLVTQNGIIMMGTLALVLILATRGSVKFLVVLYSITVFITFVLSHAGMVRHWWQCRQSEKKWLRKITVSGFGLALCTFILISMAILKFDQGGWLTLLVTGLLIALALAVKKHYNNTAHQLKRLDDLFITAIEAGENRMTGDCPEPAFDTHAKTAVLLVNGFNGLGIHTLLNVIRLFEGTFKNFVFVQVGLIDVGNFKGASEVDNLREHISSEGLRYVAYMKRHGYYAECYSAVGVDVVDEIDRLVPQILDRFPKAVLFGGQLVFQKEYFFLRWLHNHTIFAVQKRLYHEGIPILILPIRV